MAGFAQASLPFLAVADFGPGLDHAAESYQGGKVFFILHKNDPARGILPNLTFSSGDHYTYVFVHGGEENTRFENMRTSTHEIPVAVVADLLTTEFGGRLASMDLRMCTCYGNMLRPGDSATLVQQLARLLPQTQFEAYHGLVLLDASPPAIRLGRAVRWDATSPVPGPVIIGPPGPWERVRP